MMMTEEGIRVLAKKERKERKKKGRKKELDSKQQQQDRRQEDTTQKNRIIAQGIEPVTFRTMQAAQTCQ
jgi:hypothetical protein